MVMVMGPTSVRPLVTNTLHKLRSEKSMWDVGTIFKVSRIHSSPGHETLGQEPVSMAGGWSSEENT